VINKYHPPFWLKTLSSGIVTWECNRNQKKIYLTFDDGPHPRTTPSVLRLLSDYNARATFFILGRNARAYPGLADDILKSGHTLGNHTFSHRDGWKTSLKEYLDDVDNCSKIVNSWLFRPPYGRIGPVQLFKLRAMGYKVIMWSVLTGDYEICIQKEILLENSLSRIRNGSIVVMHESIKAANNCLFLLENILQHFSDRGYLFEALDEHQQDNCVNFELLRKKK
jgi:peptidoglycan-N-acetylglucosamine deacetylase